MTGFADGLKGIFHRYATPTPDPLVQLSYAASAAISDAGQAVLEVSQRYTSKISGLLSTVAGGALLYEGVTSGNKIIMASAAAALAADAVLVIYGDPSRAAHEDNPQDRPFSWSDIVNPKEYPHESASAAYTAAFAGMTASDIIKGNGVEFGSVGVTSLISTAVTTFVREKEKPTEHFENAVLNFPGIKQVANFVETRPNLAGGLVAMAGYAHHTVNDLARNGWQMSSSLPAITFSTAATASWLYYLFTEKRGRVHDTDKDAELPDPHEPAHTSYDGEILFETAPPERDVSHDPHMP